MVIDCFHGVVYIDATINVGSFLLFLIQVGDFVPNSAKHLSMAPEKFLINWNTRFHLCKQFLCLHTYYKCVKSLLSTCS